MCDSPSYQRVKCKVGRAATGWLKNKDYQQHRVRVFLIKLIVTFQNVPLITIFGVRMCLLDLYVFCGYNKS